MDRLKYSLLIALSVGLGCWARPSQALVGQGITFQTPVATVRAGDTVLIDVILTNTSAAVNAVNLHLSYSKTLLHIDAISRERSALTLWPVAPIWNQQTGTIQATGGLPNGLYANQVRIFTIIATAEQAGTAKVSVDSNSAEYLNDGLGTAVAIPLVVTSIEVSNEFVPAIAISSSSHPSDQQWSRNATVEVSWPIAENTQYSFAFSLDGAILPDDMVHVAAPQSYVNLPDGRYVFYIKSRPNGGSWSALSQRWFLIDQMPPEPFQLLHPDPSTVGGQQVLAWSALDRESGVVRAKLSVAGVHLTAQQADQVTSPLRLDPRWAGHAISVTVMDGAGNSRTASWVMPGPGGIWNTWYLVIGAVFVVGVLVMVGFWLRRR